MSACSRSCHVLLGKYVFGAFKTTSAGIDFQIGTWSVRASLNRICEASLSLSASLWMMSALFWLFSYVLVYTRLNLHQIKSQGTSFCFISVNRNEISAGFDSSLLPSFLLSFCPSHACLVFFYIMAALLYLFCVFTQLTFRILEFICTV